MFLSFFGKQCWKKNTHLAKVWFDFPLPNAIIVIITLALCGTLTTQLKPIKPQNNMKKRLEGAALDKNDLPANFFTACTSPKYNQFRLAFLSVRYKHTFWHVFQKLRHAWVSYISWYVLGSMSLSSLPIFAQQRGRKHNDIQKNATFWVKPHSCLIIILW